MLAITALLLMQTVDQALAGVVVPSGAGTLTIGPQAMEGNLQIHPGDTIKAGYDFTMPGAHAAAQVTLDNASITMNLTCVNGTSPTLTFPLPVQTYSDPAGSSNWYPSGDQSSSAVYQGSVVAPDLCAGSVMSDPNGATFKATIFSTDTTDKVNFRFHYSDNTSGSWSATITASPTPTAKTVLTATLTPTLGLTLAADHSSAIPGDTVTYSGTVTNTGATLTIGGDFTASATGSSTATVKSYWDDVATSLDSTTWTALAGTSAAQSGYTPTVAPPISSGMTLASTSVSSSGVTYPTSGDPLLGTTMTSGSSALWHYTATVPLTSSQVTTLLDPTKTKAIRNSFHLEVSPANPSVTQPSIINVDFSGIFFGGSPTPSGAVTNITVTVQPPSGAPIQVTSAQVSGLSSLASGAAANYSATYRVPVVAAKGTTETDTAYAARLQGIEGSALKASASVSGSSTGGAVTANAQPVSTTEHLPIVTITKSGPASIVAGQTGTFPLTLTNGGGATASEMAVTDSVPSGTSGTVSGIPSSLAPGASSSGTQATFLVQVNQSSGSLTDTASVTWQDANANTYGSVSSMFTTQVQAANKLTITANAGPNPTGANEAITATLVDLNNQPVANANVFLSVTGANTQQSTVVSDASGRATFNYLGANAGTDTVQASTNSGVQSNTLTITWFTPIQKITISGVQGTFFQVDPSAQSFVATPSTPPAFQQNFPNIAFNPPPRTVLNNISNINPQTPPFTDVTTDMQGNFNGSIVAQGNGFQAGQGSLASFDAVFTGSFIVNAASDVSFNVYAADGFMLGVGGGASRVSGINQGLPASGTSPFQGYSLLGGYNGTNAFVVNQPVTVHFPSAGTYAFELDYFHCCGHEMSLTLAAPSSASASVGGIFATGHDPDFHGVQGPNPAAAQHVLQKAVAFTTNGKPNPKMLLVTDVHDPGGGYSDPRRGLTAAGYTYDVADDGTGGGSVLDLHSVNFGSYDVVVIASDFGGWLRQTELSILNARASALNIFVNNGGGLVALAEVGSGIGLTSHDQFGFLPCLAAAPANASEAGDTLTSFGASLGLVASDVNSNFYHTTFGGSCNLNIVDQDSVGRVVTVAGRGVATSIPPSASLALTPANPIPSTTGLASQVTVAAMDPSGMPVKGLSVTLGIFGANQLNLVGTTGNDGLVTFSYVGTNPGTDRLQASAVVTNMPLVSNVAVLNWTNPGTSSSNPNPPPAPAITSPSPADGTVVTKPIPISASFTPPAGQTITSWSVTYQEQDPLPPVTLASGTGTPPTPLAIFDPTLLPNDTYLLTLSATASGGGTQVLTTSVVVSGNLKLGRYQAVYQDLSVPVGGLQMSVRRVYDSIDKHPGDFGVGWHVQLANFRVTTNRQLGAGGWSQYNKFCAIGLCLTGFKTSAPHYVIVTFPDGHEESFDFTPSGGTNVFGGGSAAFTPRTGTTSSLQAAGDPSLTYLYDGNLYGSDGLPYNPTRFTLTTRDGRVLSLDTALGLISETDSSGNTLTVDSTGVHSSLGPSSSPTTGPSITFTRDSQGRITDITGPVTGQHYHYAYFPSTNELQAVTNPAGNTFTYTYDPQTGDLQQSVDPNNKPTQSLTYDSSGRLVSIANGSEPPTTIKTSVAGQQQVFLDPNGQASTVLTYDDLGDVIERDDSFGGKTLKTLNTYDAVGRLTSITDPLQHTTQAVYDESTGASNGNLLSLTDASSRTWSMEQYNSFGEPGLIRKPDNTVLLTFSYDTSNGELLSDQRPGEPATSYTYGTRGQLISVKDPGGRSVSYGYDANGYLSSASDSLGRSVNLVSDAAGRVTQMSDQLGDLTTYSYNADDTLASHTDPNKRTWQYFYDALGRLHEIRDPLGHSAYYNYNAAGLVGQRIDRNGNTTSYQYDADGQLVLETRPGNDSVAFAYDPLERLIGAEGASGHVMRGYDDAGQLTTETSCAPTGAPITPCSPASPTSTQPTVTMSYSYWPDGRPKAATSSDAGSVQFSFDVLGRLNSLVDPAQATFGFGYDAFGRLNTISRPNGITDTMTYSSSSDLLTRESSLNGSVVSRFDYGVDPANGRWTSLADNAGAHVFGYYDNGRLSSAAHPSGFPFGSESYSYDAAGNRLSWPSVPSATYDAAERIQTDGQFNYAFDAEGELVSKVPVGGGAGTIYSWDVDHELTGIKYADGSTSTYRYDPLGRRIASNDRGTETRYVYDGVNVHADYNAQNQVQSSYVTGLGVNTILETITGTQRTFSLTDGQGSVRAITDASGAVVGHYDYDSFGRPAPNNSSASRYTYTGYQYDPASGLYYAGARYYDPQVGRFLSEDPLPSINPYTYAGNDPVNLVDLLGAQAEAEYAELVEADVNNAQCISGVVDAISSTAIAAAASALGGGAPTAELVNGAIAKGLRQNAAACLLSGAGALRGTNRAGQVTSRGKFRGGTLDKMWSDAADGPTGGKLCPRCGAEVHVPPGQGPRDWHGNHNPAWTTREFPPDVTRQQVLDNYQEGTGLLCPACNLEAGELG